MGDGTFLHESPHDPDVIFTVGSGYWNSAYWLMMSRSTDGGETWHGDTLDSLYRGNAFCYDFGDDSAVYVAGDSDYSYPMFRVSTDLGQTWQERKAGLAGSVVAIACVPGDPELLFCGSYNGLYKTTDAGLSWTRKGTFTTVRAIAVDAVSPEVVYAASYYGIYVSTDAGETWAEMNSGLGTTDVLSLALRPGPSGALYCGTNGRGIYVTDPLVAVAEERQLAVYNSRLPTIVCHILFVPASSFTPRTSLFSHSGRKVMSLRPGANDVGRLAPGVYFVREAREQAQAVHKVVVTR